MAICSAGDPGTPPPVVSGQTVLELSFDEAEPLRGWQAATDPHVQLAPDGRGGRAVRIERPKAEGAGSQSIRYGLPLEGIRGARIRVQARVKAEEVSEPPHPWNGVKCMIHTVGPAGKNWQQQNDLFGSFDWKPLRFVAEVPPDATEAWLILGLEAVTGSAMFDQIQIVVVGTRRQAPAQRPGGPVYKGHSLPRLRGAMIGPRVTADDLRTFGLEWKANHVRWQLIWGGFPRSPADRAGVDEYRHWLHSALARLDELLPVCRQAGLVVLVDMHTPPGGRNASNECRMFHEAQFQKAFVEIWEQIAHRYRGNQTIWGYDLVNEPVEGVVAEGLLDWQALAELAARRIRAIDPEHAIIVEPAPWGSPPSLDWFEPIDVPGVVYSVHMYQPHRFTHQGVHGNPMGVHYPGEVDGRYYDKAALKTLLEPVVRFQRDYNVHIYVGEFSAIRWAPGDSAYNYLRDCIEIFEENGWDWAYHAFREWDGWSVEHGPDPADRRPASAPTNRALLLRGFYGRNAKPLHTVQP